MFTYCTVPILCIPVFISFRVYPFDQNNLHLWKVSMLMQMAFYRWLECIKPLMKIASSSKCKSHALCVTPRSVPYHKFKIVFFCWKNIWRLFIHYQRVLYVGFIFYFTLSVWFCVYDYIDARLDLCIWVEYYLLINSKDVLVWKNWHK